MQISDEYRLSQYHNLGRLEDNKNIYLKRRISDGKICVEKHVSDELFDIYRFLQYNSNIHIPEIYECIKVEGELIVIEEYIEGQTLEDIVHEKNINDEEAAEIIIQLCKGLSPLHHANPPIICRDLKPENIMLDTQQCVKIVDFNIARSFQKGKKQDTCFMGTVGYAAPEQFGFAQTDNRTDIYALGVLFNYLITGKLPVEQIATGKSEVIIRKCVRLDSSQRYQCVEDLENDLLKLAPGSKNIVCDKPKENDVDSRKYSFVPPGFRRKKLCYIITSVLGYLFLIYFCFSLDLSQDGKAMAIGMLRLEQAAILVSQIMMVFIVWNYRGWRERLPLVKSNNILLRIVGYIIIEFMLIMIAAFICVLLESVFF